MSFVKDLENAASLAMDLANLERATFNKGGQTHENVATHSLMLTMFIMSIDNVFAASGMDQNKCIRYAVVHDALESRTGDTNTLADYDPVAKAAAEVQALADMKVEFGEDSDLFYWIESYEQLCDPSLSWNEAQFVRLMDKLAPKLTHKFDGEACLRSHGLTREEYIERCWQQVDKLQGDYINAPAWVWNLFKLVIEDM